MSNSDFGLTADAEFDDLPRTLRREREARERQKRDQEDRERLSRERESNAPKSRDRLEDPPKILRPDATLHVPRNADLDEFSERAGDFPAATVRRFDVPFLHLMAFFLKAVLASVPALILLGAILWTMGQVLKTLFPWLVKMQIFIQFPN